MICVICKRTEEEIKKAHSSEISLIDKTIAIIQNEIAKTEACDKKTNEIKQYPEINEKNCSGKSGTYCRECGQSHSIDDAGYYWCEVYKKSIDASSPAEKNKGQRTKIINRLKSEIGILENKRKEWGLVDINSFEIKHGNNSDAETIIKNYIPENEIAEFYKNNTSKASICSDCRHLLESLIENCTYRDLEAAITEDIREDFFYEE